MVGPFRILSEKKSILMSLSSRNQRLFAFAVALASVRRRRNGCSVFDLLFDPVLARIRGIRGCPTPRRLLELQNDVFFPLSPTTATISFFDYSFSRLARITQARKVTLRGMLIDDTKALDTYFLWVRSLNSLGPN